MPLADWVSADLEAHLDQQKLADLQEHPGWPHLLAELREILKAAHKKCLRAEINASDSEFRENAMRVRILYGILSVLDKDWEQTTMLEVGND